MNASKTIDNTISKDTIFSNNSKGTLKEEDWDLSCTLDMTTK